MFFTVGSEPVCDHFRLFQSVQLDDFEAELAAKLFGIVESQSISCVEVVFSSVDRHKIVNHDSYDLNKYYINPRKFQKMHLACKNKKNFSKIRHNCFIIFNVAKKIKNCDKNFTKSGSYTRFIALTHIENCFFLHRIRSNFTN